LKRFDDICHRKGLAASGNTKKCLVPMVILDALGELRYRRRLVACGFHIRHYLKSCHFPAVFTVF
jgi:hypothetical protein